MARRGRRLDLVEKWDGKPPFSLPTMDEIRGIEWNGLKVASTFSGTGGSCLGYRMAGYRVKWAGEFNPIAAACYSLNHDSHVDGRDVREVVASDILEHAGVGVGELDIFDGSPPCTSFSMAGSRAKGWGKTKEYSDAGKVQAEDDLFEECIRLLGELQPRAFVAENVPAMATGKAVGYFKRAIRAMKDEGYNVRAQVLNSQWLGVPQSRRRLFFIGVRKDVGEPPSIEPWGMRWSLQEAFEGCPAPVGEDETGPSFVGYALHGHWKKLPWGGQCPNPFQLRRCHPGEVSPTVVRFHQAGSACGVHWEVPRKFHIPELRRICGFPDDFALEGDHNARVGRLGCAVPPPMTAAVARALSEVLCGSA